MLLAGDLIPSSVVVDQFVDGFSCSIAESCPPTTNADRSTENSGAGRGFGAASGDTLRINEIMATNASGLKTRVREIVSGPLGSNRLTPDWIELKNETDGRLDLSGYHLSDNEQVPGKWTFPANTFVEPNGFLIVFASGLDLRDPRLDESGRLHANFKLDGAGGEYLSLTAPDGMLLDEINDIPEQFADISFGKQNSDSKYFQNATPAAVNNSSVYEGVVADVSLSVQRGFFDRAFSVTLGTNTINARIRFTTDGSEPTATHGSNYTGAINIATTTNLRAAAFKDGFIPASIETHSYVFLQNVIRQPARTEGFPFGGQVLAGRETYVPQDTEMDPAIVNDPAYRDVILDALQSIPSMSITSDPTSIFGDRGWHDGENVETGVSIEVLYFGEQDKNHQANAGIESHSHDRLKRSLRLNFRGQYGDATFKTDLLQNGPLNGDTAVDEFKRLILRGGNNRSWARVFNPDKTTYTIDEFYRATQIAMSGYGAHGTFVHLYINGVYWGLYNPVERIDEFFAASYFGGDTEDWFAANHTKDLAGDDDRFDLLVQTLIHADFREPQNYAELQEYLDVESFADYLINAWWFAASDWPQNNWHGYNRSDASELGSTPFRFSAWDGEQSFGQGGQSSPNGKAHVHFDFRSNQQGDNKPIAQLWHAARRNSNFRMMFADRVYAHLFNDGALTEENARERWAILNEFIGDAIVAESARWGDSLESAGQPTRTRDEDWQRQVDHIDQLIVGNTQAFIDALRREGYFPDINPPVLSRQEGHVTAGEQLTFFNANPRGEIYVTLDGSDPRTSGGHIAPSAALVDSGTTVSLVEDVSFKARVFDGAEWSALSETKFVVHGETKLRVSEIMYNPPTPSSVEIAAGFADNDDFEFIEIQNVGDSVIQLQDYRFDEGIRFTFPATQLGAGERMVIVSNENAFRMRYGAAAHLVGGQFTQGALDNSGERLALLDPLDRTVLDFQYDDGGLWPDHADGVGASLELIDPENVALNRLSHFSEWRGSTEFGGSPGARGQDPIGVVINEVLANTDGTQYSDSIELRNISNTTFDISGWLLSDSDNNFWKFRIPNGTILSPNEFVVFDESHFNQPNSDSGFALSGNRGDHVWLVVPFGEERVHAFVDHIEFEATRVGESIGRIPNFDGLVPMLSPSLGIQNGRPRVGPLVVSEVNYASADPSVATRVIFPSISRNDLDFIEIYNPTNSSVDLTNWQIGGGVEFAFPDSLVLAARSTVLVTSFDPALTQNGDRLRAFRAQYPMPNNAMIAGGYVGRLANEGDVVRLLRPESAPIDQPEMIPLSVEDEVVYLGIEPWPAISSSTRHSSLNRTGVGTLGNLANSWRTSSPSPGRVSFQSTTQGDFDENGHVDAHDIDMLCSSVRGNFDSIFDLDGNGTVNSGDLTRLIRDILNTSAGDSNLDGVFDSGDFVNVFISGEFEDRVVGNSGWADGDWNCDGDFTTRYIIVAFKGGSFARTARFDISSIAGADIAARFFELYDNDREPKRGDLIEQTNVA